MKINISLIGKLVLTVIMFAGIFGVSSINTFAQDKDDKDEKEEKVDPKLAKEAKLTMEQAREIALKARPGKIEEEELEKEKGRLIYSFDIRDAQGILFEVEVDAKTGEVVSNKEDTEDDDDDKPNVISSVKSGTVKGAKAIGHGTKSAVRKVAGIFKS